MKINLGSGKDYRQGWINIDVGKNLKTDINCDLSNGVPLKDCSVSEVFASHFIEHIYDTILIMNEVWRVCQNGAIVNIVVPHQSNPLAFADPTHKRIFNEESFKYFCSNGSHYHSHVEYGIKCDFELIEQKVTVGSGGEVRVKLKAIKE